MASRKTLSYRAALRTAGATDAKWLKTIDNILSGAILASAPVTGGATLSLIDPKTEIIKLVSDRATSMCESMSNIKFADRTSAFEAAYTILAYVSCWEVAAERLAAVDERVTKKEILSELGRLTPQVLSLEMPLPDSTVPLSDLHKQTLSSVAELTSIALNRLRHLNIFDQLDETKQNRCAHILTMEVPRAAVGRFQDTLRKMRTDVPEFGLWIRDVDQARLEQLITRRAHRDELETFWGSLAAKQSDVNPAHFGGLRSNLRAVYKAKAQAPLVEDATTWLDVSLDIPLSKSASYVEHSFRVGRPADGASMAQESWWTHVPEDNDLTTFLLRTFSTTKCYTEPLIILGHPGSGKSLLTQLMAYRLSETDMYCPVQIPLRRATPTKPIGQQVADAIEEATNIATTWAEFRGGLGDVVPVIMFDGLDELLMTTGQTHADYIKRVADFQASEAHQGRPIVTTITSRTTVMTRAVLPPEYLAIRLEPFNKHQTELWLDTWRTAVNSARPGQDSLTITADTVRWASELITQPILLFMLALKEAVKPPQVDKLDSFDPPPQLASKEPRRVHLYEALLRSFVEREIARELPAHASLVERRETMLKEMARLEIAALSMFNRGGQSVLSGELDADFEALGMRAAHDSHGERTSLAEQQLSRFFFVVSSEAREQSDRLRETITRLEFLHLTFQEFLVARFLVGRIVAVRSARNAPAGDTTPTDEADASAVFFHHQSLCDYPNVLEFVKELWRALQLWKSRAALVETCRSWSAWEPTGQASRSRYQPRPTRSSEAVAVLSANAVVLWLLLAGTTPLANLPLTAAPDGGAPPAADTWRRLVLSWEAFLPRSSWQNLLRALVLDLSGSDARLSLAINGSSADVALGKTRLSVGANFITPVRNDAGGKFVIDKSAEIGEQATDFARTLRLQFGPNSSRQVADEVLSLVSSHQTLLSSVPANMDQSATGPSTLSLYLQARTSGLNELAVENGGHLLALTEVVEIAVSDSGDLLDVVMDVLSVVDRAGRAVPLAVLERLTSALVGTPRSSGLRRVAGAHPVPAITVGVLELIRITAAAGGQVKSLGDPYTELIERQLSYLRDYEIVDLRTYLYLFVSLRSHRLSQGEVVRLLGRVEDRTDWNNATRFHDWPASAQDDFLSVIRMSGFKHIAASIGERIVLGCSERTLAQFSLSNVLYVWDCLDCKYSYSELTTARTSVARRWSAADAQARAFDHRSLRMPALENAWHALQHLHNDRRAYLETIVR